MKNPTRHCALCSSDGFSAISCDAMNSKCPKIMHENLMTRIKQKRKVNLCTQYLFTSQIRPAAQSSAGGGHSGASGRGGGAACGITSDRYVHNSIDFAQHAKKNRGGSSSIFRKRILILLCMVTFFSPKSRQNYGITIDF